MSSARIRFGPYCFDPDRGLLYRDGRPSALGTKAAILLRMLIEARGDVVSKSDLMDAAWPSMHAEISNLTVQITALRRCLDDNRKCPTWIETLHGVGYRFAGDVEIVNDRATVRASSKYRDWPRVALTPFELLEGASHHPHIADGFQKSMVAELSRLPVHLSATKHPAAAKAPLDKRGCDYRIGGRIEIQQGRLNVEMTVRSCRATKATEKVSVFKGELSDLFQAQAQQARRVATLLYETLSESAVNVDCLLDNVAQRYYDRGCRLLVRSPAGNRSARMQLSEAIRLDPGFAKAHAFLGIGHFTAAIHYGEDERANRALALAYANKAVALASEDATAHCALGYVQLNEGRFTQAEDSLSEARRHDQSDTFILMNMADLRVLQGRHDEAIEFAKEAIRENENPPDWYYWYLAFGHYAAGDYVEAVDALSRPGIGMFPGIRILAASLAQLGYRREAKIETERFLVLHPGFSISGWAETQPFMHREDLRHFMDGFAKAGFPA